MTTKLSHPPERMRVPQRGVHRLGLGRFLQRGTDVAKSKRKECSVEGCTNPGLHRNGWCRTHYHRDKKFSSLEPRPVGRQRLAEFCSVEGCNQSHYTHGVCRNHAYRLNRYGDPLGRPARPSEEERFLSHTRRSENGCLEWTAVKPNGYGLFKMANRKMIQAHRWAYQNWVGPIPEGHHIHHLCENKACVEIVHLEPRNPSEHLKHHNPRLECCKRGHPFDPDNTIIKVRADGRVVHVCRICANWRQRLYNRGKKVKGSG